MLADRQSDLCVPACPSGENGTMKIGDLLKTKTTTLRDVLTKPIDANTMTVTVDSEVIEAARRITANSIGALAVVDEAGLVIGIITEKDIVRVISQHGGDALQKPVASVMTPNPTCAKPDDSSHTTLLTMIHGRHRHVPVIEDGVLLGVVMSLDVAKARLSETTSESMALIKLVPDLIADHGECYPDDEIEVVFERMNSLGLRCLPVRENEKVIGVVTSSDIARAKIGG